MPAASSRLFKSLAALMVVTFAYYAMQRAPLGSITCRADQPSSSPNPSAPRSKEQPDSTDRASDAEALRNWPQWRGPLATGVAPHATPPVEWSETKNVKWKVPLPGKGHSTPIIWKDRIYLTAAVPVGDPLEEPRYSNAPGAHDNLPVTHHQQYIVIALDRATGKTIWQKTLHENLPHEGAHTSASLASNSPVTDGQNLYAFFGSHGLYALNLAGDLLWKTDLGKMNTKHGHGEGASPVLHQDTLFVNWDHEGQSFIAAFDKTTGQLKWKTPRDEVTSWATPIIVIHEGEPQLIVSGTNRLRAYDPATGKVIWECGGLAANIVASPVAGHGMVFAGSSYEKRLLLAVRLAGAKGDITGSPNVAWTEVRGTPYVPSPLLYGDALYFLSHYQGVLTRLDAKTGAPTPGRFRLPGILNAYASPVAADNRVYITSRQGATLVITHTPNPEALALNQLEDTFNASPALIDSELYLRGEKSLYRISKD